MACNDKISNTCGQRINARCVFYDGYIPDDSILFGEGCINLEETTEDLYNITDEIKSEIDLSALGSNCLTYDEETLGDIKIKEAALKFEEEICLLKTAVAALPSGDGTIDVTTIDTSCLEDVCGTGFASPNDLIQAIIQKLCEIEAIVTAP